MASVGNGKGGASSAKNPTGGESMPFLFQQQAQQAPDASTVLFQAQPHSQELVVPRKMDATMASPLIGLDGNISRQAVLQALREHINSTGLVIGLRSPEEVDGIASHLAHHLQSLQTTPLNEVQLQQIHDASTLSYNELQEAQERDGYAHLSQVSQNALDADVVCDDDVYDVIPDENEERRQEQILSFKLFLQATSFTPQQTFSLPLTKDEFMNALESGQQVDLHSSENQTMLKSLPKFVHAVIDKQCADYKAAAEEYNKVRDRFERHVELYERNRVPQALQQKATFQFKDGLEHFSERQEESQLKRAQEDFLTQLQSTREWLQNETQRLAHGTFIATKVGELYDLCVKKTLRSSAQQLLVARSRLIGSMHEKIEETQGQIVRRKEKLRESTQKQDADIAEKEEALDKFVQELPQVALAVLLRELELRLISILQAQSAGSSVSEAYAKTRKDQQLSLLEERVYKMKDTLLSKNAPAVYTKTLVNHVRKLNGVQQTAGSNQKRGTSRDRTASKERTANFGRQRSTSKEKSGPQWRRPQSHARSNSPSQSKTKPAGFSRPVGRGKGKGAGSRPQSRAPKISSDGSSTEEATLRGRVAKKTESKKGGSKKNGAKTGILKDVSRVSSLESNTRRNSSTTEATERARSTSKQRGASRPRKNSGRADGSNSKRSSPNRTSPKRSSSVRFAK